MLAELTEEVFRTFIYGTISLIGSKVLFESGKSYVKTAGSNKFKGKTEALPFFVTVLISGYILQHLDPHIDDAMNVIPVLSRVGIIVFGTMFVFNYIVPDFNHTDEQSTILYVIGFGLSVWPFI